MLSRFASFIFFAFAGAALTFAALNAYVVYERSNFFESAKPAEEGKVAFVLNQGSLNSKQGYSVIRSYRSQRSLDGDHIDFHCIQLSEFIPNERFQSEWVFGVEKEPLLAEARSSAFSLGEPKACFGSDIEPDSPDVAAFISSMNVFSRHVEGADITFFHKPTMRLLYVSYSS